MTVSKRQIPDDNGTIFIDYLLDGALCISQDASEFFEEGDKEQIIFVQNIPEFLLQLHLLLSEKVDEGLLK